MRPIQKLDKYTCEIIADLQNTETQSALILEYRQENGDRMAGAFSHVFTSTTKQECVNINGCVVISPDAITAHYFVPYKYKSFYQG